MRPKEVVPTVVLALGLASLGSPQQAGPQAGAPGCLSPDPCRRAARPGEIAIAFLGDSGYGPGGASEWGTHAQSEVAERLQELCPRPDLVLFLGDNIYWRGSPDLFGPRFDTMYPRLLDAEGRRVHAALGNHDIKGCQLVEQPAFRSGESCADALVRLLREDVKQEAGASTRREAAPGPEGGPASAPPVAEPLAPGILGAAQAVDGRHCPPAFDLAYEQSASANRTCFAGFALRHPAFGYGLRGESRLRYYTIDRTAPPPPGGDAPIVRVLVADSNTLDTPGGGPEPGGRASLDVGSHPPEPAGQAAKDTRSDRLQALWMENQLRTAPSGAWTLVAMHHPVFTPRACVVKLLGKCVGGHQDQDALRAQLWPVFGFGSAEVGTSATAEAPAAPAAAPQAPDFVLAAHNHFYARSRPLGASGRPADGTGAVRHFVSGGGGAPLYRLFSTPARFAAAGIFHHFVYLRLRAREAFFWAIDQHGKVRDAGCFRKGEAEDRCIERGSFTSDELVCGAPVSEGRSCPTASVAPRSR